MPRVSVVIPSYNHAAFIAEAVSSVLTQSETDLELIVVDDGSTDHSLDVLASFADPRLSVIAQENRGAHAAINRGLEAASGRFLAVLNSDDAYHPQRLERLTALLEAETDVGLAASHIEVVTRRGRVLDIKHGYKDLEPWPLERRERSFRASDDLRAALLTENYLATTSNYVFRRKCFEDAGPFRPLRYTHDWDFALRVARLARLAVVAEPLLRYRVHRTNTIREDQAAMIFEICWCLAVHLPRHMADSSWFGEAPIAARIDQLLHSINAFGCERVLGVMLLQDLSSDERLQLALLHPDDVCRQVYIDSIRHSLASCGRGPARGLLARAGSAARRLARWMKAGG